MNGVGEAEGVGTGSGDVGGVAIGGSGFEAAGGGAAGGVDVDGFGEDDVDGDEIEKDLWDAVVVKTRRFGIAMINTSKATDFKQGIIWRVVVLKLELRGDRETLE